MARALARRRGRAACCRARLRCSPRVEALPGDFLEGELRETGAPAARRASCATAVGRGLAPLFRARDAELAGPARGLVFQLGEALGACPRRRCRAAARSARAPPIARRLARLGVRLGTETVYVEPLLKPPAGGARAACSGRCGMARRSRRRRRGSARAARSGGFRTRPMPRWAIACWGRGFSASIGSSGWPRRRGAARGTGPFAPSAGARDACRLRHRGAGGAAAVLGLSRRARCGDRRGVFHARSRRTAAQKQRRPPSGARWRRQPLRQASGIATRTMRRPDAPER